MTEEYVIQPLEQRKLDQLTEAWSRMLTCVVHDLTTPLAVMRMAGGGIAKNLLPLLEGYQLAVNHQLLPEPTLNKKQIDRIKQDTLPTIEQTVTEILDFLYLLRPYNQKLLSTSPETSILSVKNFVTNIIENYPVTHDKKHTLIHFKCAYDFKASGNVFFMECLLNHLLHNALRIIDEKRRGEISIWTEEGEDYNSLHFKDTASGIDENHLPHVFDRFFSKRENNVTPGLGFCRLALLQRGGDVVCYSVKNEYTHFVIKFPKQAED